MARSTRGNLGTLKVSFEVDSRALVKGIQAAEAAIGKFAKNLNSLAAVVNGKVTKAFAGFAAVAQTAGKSAAIAGTQATAQLRAMSSAADAAAKSMRKLNA